MHPQYSLHSLICDPAGLRGEINLQKHILQVILSRAEFKSFLSGLHWPQSTVSWSEQSLSKNDTPESISGAHAHLDFGRSAANCLLKSVDCVIASYLMATSQRLSDTLRDSLLGSSDSLSWPSPCGISELWLSCISLSSLWADINHKTSHQFSAFVFDCFEKLP